MKQLLILSILLNSLSSFAQSWIPLGNVSHALNANNTIGAICSDKVTIRLYDVSGRLMEAQEVYNSTAASFNIKSYAAGLYLYQVITDDKTQTGKVIIE